MSIDVEDVERAKQIIFGGYQLSARDALHVAVITRHDIDTVMSFDHAFEHHPGLTRLS